MFNILNLIHFTLMNNSEIIIVSLLHYDCIVTHTFKYVTFQEKFK